MTSGNIATGGYLSQAPVVFPSLDFCAYFCSWQAKQGQMDYIAPFASSKVWIQCKLRSQCNYMYLLFSHPSHPKLKMLMFTLLHGVIMTRCQPLRSEIPSANRCSCACHLHWPIGSSLSGLTRMLDPFTQMLLKLSTAQVYEPPQELTLWVQFINNGQ